MKPAALEFTPYRLVFRCGLGGLASRGFQHPGPENQPFAPVSPGSIFNRRGPPAFCLLYPERGGDFRDGRHRQMRAACFKAIFWIGVVPWILLGWQLSRNASFGAKRTGAWSGVSAFLLGSLVTLMHYAVIGMLAIWWRSTS